MKYIKSRTYPNLTLSIKFPIAPAASKIQVMYTGIYFLINGVLRTTYVIKHIIITVSTRKALIFPLNIPNALPLFLRYVR